MADPAGFRWDDVRLFLAVMRSGSLAGASTRLGVDASTVSRRLVGFEAAVGKRLFDRLPEGLAPTQAAEQLLPAAEQTEQATFTLRQAAEGLEARVEGVVRLAVPPGMADTFLLPVLAKLYARHPRLRLELDVATGLADLTRREADLALRTVRPRSGDLVMQRLGVVPWAALGSPALVKRLGRLERWTDADWVGWDAALAMIPAAAWMTKHVSGEPRLRISGAGQLSAIEAGIGIGLMPKVFCKVRPLAPVRFAKRLGASAAQWPSDELWLVGHRALRAVPRIAAVWNFCLERARETLAA